MNNLSMDIWLAPNGANQYRFEVSQNYEGSPWYVVVYQVNDLEPLDIRRLKSWTQVLFLMEEIQNEKCYGT